MSTRDLWITFAANHLLHYGRVEIPANHAPPIVQYAVGDELGIRTVIGRGSRNDQRQIRRVDR